MKWRSLVPRMTAQEWVGFAGFVVICLVLWGVVSAFNSCWDGVTKASSERRATEAAEKQAQAKEFAEARARDEAAASFAKMLADGKVAAHKATVAHYATMSPAQRAAMVAKLCTASAKCSTPISASLSAEELSAGDDECCSHSQLAALVEAANGAPEAAKLTAAAEAIEKRHDQAANPTTQMARCCDGTTSGSCECPGHQGCCSHHGGVCGCQ